MPVSRAGAATSNMARRSAARIVGGFVPFPATHVHDELHARCLVLDDGKTKLVFVVCDLLGIDRLVSDEARALIQQDLNIPKDNVLISATHTHSACSALGKDARIVRDTVDDYQRFVARRIVDGVKRAHNLLRPAQIAFGSAEAAEHVFNRRWHMKPGSMPPNPFGSIDKGEDEPARRQRRSPRTRGADRSAILFLFLRRSPMANRSRSSRPTRCTTSAASARGTSPPITSRCTAKRWNVCSKPNGRRRRSSR